MNFRILLSPLLLLLLAQDPGDAEKLVRQLGSEEIAERDAATEALRKLGEAARPALAKAAEFADVEAAGRAKRLLRILDLGRSLPPGVKRIDPDAARLVAEGRVRILLEKAEEEQDGQYKLPWIRQSDIEFLVLEGLQQEATPADRRRLLHAARKHWIVKAGPRIVELLKTADAELVEEIFEVLVEPPFRLHLDEAIGILAGRPGFLELAKDRWLVLASPEGLPALRKAWADATPEFRAYLVDFIVQLDGPDGLVQIRKDMDGEDPKLRAKGALFALHFGLADAPRDLPRWLRDPSPEVRIAALDGARAFGANIDPALVLPLLEDPDPELRREAIRTVEALRIPGARDALVKLLGDSDEKFRLDAASILPGAGGPPPKAELEKLLGDPSPGVRTAAAKARFALDPREWAGAYLDCLAKEKQLPDLETLEALHWLEPAKAQAVVLEILGGPGFDLRGPWGNPNQFRSLGPPSQPAVLRLLKEGTVEQRQMMIQLALTWRFEGAVAAVKEVARGEDDEVAEFASGQLVERELPGYETELADLVRDPAFKRRPFYLKQLSRVDPVLALDLARSSTRSDSEEVRKVAVSLLAEEPGHADRKLLAEVFLAAPTDERRKYLEALGRGGVVEIVPEVLKMLEDPKVENRLCNAAFEYLEEVGASGVADKVLPQFLEGRAPWSCDRILERDWTPVLADSMAKAALEAKPGPRSRALSLLYRLGDRRAEDLALRALEAREGEVKEAAIGVLQGLARPGTVELIQPFLGDSAPIVRMAAGVAILALEGRAGIPKLRKWLRDPILWRACIWELARYRDRDSLPELRKYLAWRRSETWPLLALLGDERYLAHLPWLLIRFNDDDDLVLALERSSRPAVIAALAKALEHPGFRIRVAAARMAGRLGLADLLPRIRGLQEARGVSPEDQVNLLVARIRLGDREAIPKVRQVLENPLEPLAGKLVEALREVPMRELEPVLLGILGTPRHPCWDLACDYVSHCRVREAIPVLRRALGDAQWERRDQAWSALAELGAVEALPEALELLRGNPEQWSEGAARLLGHSQDPAVDEVLRRTWKLGPVGFKEAALDTLVLRRAPGVEDQVREALGHPHFHVRRRALEAVLKLDLASLLAKEEGIRHSQPVMRILTYRARAALGLPVDWAAYGRDLMWDQEPDGVVAWQRHPALWKRLSEPVELPRGAGTAREWVEALETRTGLKVLVDLEGEDDKLDFEVHRLDLDLSDRGAWIQVLRGIGIALNASWMSDGKSLRLVEPEVARKDRGEFLKQVRGK